MTTRTHSNRRNSPAGDRICQLKIALCDIEPPIWRRLLVRDSLTLADLHDILQDVMGWQNYHLWEFVILSKHYEAPDPEATGHDATTASLKDLRLGVGDRFTYIYDPGDDWQHSIILEDQCPADPDQSYPVCTGGRRACPPEDSGGSHRYAEILEILQNPEHPEYEEVADWLDDSFHPEAFDLRATNRILMLAYGGGGAV